MRSALIRCTAITLLALASGIGDGALADAEMSAISGDVDQPRRHLRLRNPADITPERAAHLYTLIRTALERGYAAAGYAPVADYQRWRRFNSTPYPSATHGNHQLNNFANDIAAPLYGSGAKMPVGSVLAKDSFVVTESGEVLLGALFTMEKMPAGFNPGAGDWRYAMVMPDGTLAGETGGAGAERVEYCIGCHLAVEATDHLYFIPQPFRLP